MTCQAARLLVWAAVLVALFMYVSNHGWLAVVKYFLGILSENNFPVPTCQETKTDIRCLVGFVCLLSPTAHLTPDIQGVLRCPHPGCALRSNQHTTVADYSRQLLS